MQFRSIRIYPISNKEKYFFIDKNQFLGEKLFFLRFFLSVLFKLVLKFSDLINSDDNIGKITLNSIRLYPVSNLKKFKVDEKRDYFQ